MEVHNEGSFLRDHGGYIENVEEVVRRIHDILEPSRVLDPFAARQLVERRARRVRLRRPLWVLAAGIACALSAPVVRLAPWVALDLSTVAVAGVLTLLVVDRAWRSWNRRVTALAMVDPVARTPKIRMASMLSSVALLVVLTVGVGGDASDHVGMNVFIDGYMLTLVAGPLTVGLLPSLDHRARAAARRSVAGPAGDTPRRREPRDRRVRLVV